MRDVEMDNGVHPLGVLWICFDASTGKYPETFLESVSIRNLPLL